MKKIILTGAAVIVIALISFAIYLSDFSANNLLPKPALPKKYESYREIDDGLSSANYHSELLLSSDNELRLDELPPLFNARDTTVIVARQSEARNRENINLSTTYYKLNRAGRVIDSLTYDDKWPTELGGFLITQSGYCSWIRDGEKEMKTYVEENNDLSADSIHLAQRFRDLHKSAQYIFYYSHYDLEDARLDSLEIDKVVFCINGRWIALLGKHLDGQDDQIRVKERSSVINMANSANTHVNLEYFHKVHYRKSPRFSWGSPNGNSTPDRWEGIGYFNLLINRDTLHFKQLLDKEDNQVSSGASPYRSIAPNYYYTNSELNFVLFTNNNYMLYLIKNKAYQ